MFFLSSVFTNELQLYFFLLFYFIILQDIIQGPFDCAHMYDWYREGFFSPTMLMRRSVDPELLPLWTYGVIPPFIEVSTGYYW